MKTLYIDCGMGAAGDMLTAALYELVEDKAAALAELNAMGIPGVVFSVSPSTKLGVTGSHMTVSVNGEVEMAGDDGHLHHHGHDEGGECDHHHEHKHHHEHSDEHEHAHDHEHTHNHEHTHEHAHHHEHRTLADVHHIIEHISVDEETKSSVIEVYDIIAAAESAAHNEPVAQVHFHEVGMMDAIADITAVCYLMKRLSPDRVIATPVHVGKGKLRCAHGILDVPAPATANILNDGNVPYYKAEIDGELCTPTGAALIKYFVDEYTDGTCDIAQLSRQNANARLSGNAELSADASNSESAARTVRVGRGMGYKDFAEAANCVTVYFAE